MPEATKPREQPHRNHGLFSDHYLNVTLPQRTEWQALTEQARPVMEGVSRVFDSYTPSDNEAQTEEGGRRSLAGMGTAIHSASSRGRYLVFLPERPALPPGT
jgi:hypothetical protein